MRLWLHDRRTFPPQPADAAEPAVWLFLQTSTAADGFVIHTWSGVHSESSPPLLAVIPTPAGIRRRAGLGEYARHAVPMAKSLAEKRHTRDQLHNNIAQLRDVIWYLTMATLSTDSTTGIRPQRKYPIEQICEDILTALCDVDRWGEDNERDKKLIDLPGEITSWRRTMRQTMLRSREIIWTSSSIRATICTTLRPRMSCLKVLSL